MAKVFKFVLNKAQLIELCPGNSFPFLHAGDIIHDEMGRNWTCPLSGFYILLEEKNNMYWIFRIGS